LATNEQVKFGGRVAFGWLSNDFFPEGHIGDPTGASDDLGARMFSGAVESLGVAMKEISRFDFGR
jgi:creatinine amidohydrolase